MRRRMKDHKGSHKEVMVVVPKCLNLKVHLEEEMHQMVEDLLVVADHLREIYRVGIKVVAFKRCVSQNLLYQTKKKKLSPPSSKTWRYQ